MENKITIEFAHICENVIEAKNDNLSIINIFNQISSMGFPAIYPKFVVVIGASRDKMNEVKDYSLNIRIISKEEKTKVITELNKTIIIPELPGQVRFLANFSPVVFPKEGFYEVIIDINNEVGKILNFEVKKLDKE